jgi:hypothetical protein
MNLYNEFPEPKGDEYKTKNYLRLKSKVLPLLSVLVAGGDNKPGLDLFGLLMSDSDSLLFQQFFIELFQEDSIADKDRRLLLDGLAQEYPGCRGWLDYTAQECEGL